MSRCFTVLHDMARAGQSAALVTVAHVAGSAPRAAGARMLVTPDEVVDTIGGGNLEFEAIRIARARLARPDDQPARFIELFPLAPMLKQCCGGAVFLHFDILRDGAPDWLTMAATCARENTPVVLVNRVGAAADPAVPRMTLTRSGASGSLGDSELERLAIEQATALLSAQGTAATALLHSLADSETVLPDIADALFFELLAPAGRQVALFGAGHVGRAVVNVLAPTDACRLIWLDGRAGQFPETVPPTVETRLMTEPVAAVAQLPAAAYCLVMTHSHQLDQALCEAILRRGDAAFLGLIGSATKYRRFLQGLKARGLTDAQLQGLTCPIGIAGIGGKEPAVIAVSVAAQLLQAFATD